tara:strand:+ start:383 stop:1366 length:984 start_codon:yes stop_codon:yes gene_type:complete
MADTFVPKIPSLFLCECCDYKTSNKKDYTKHISTRKHLNTYKGLTNTYKNPQKSQVHESKDVYDSLKKSQLHDIIFKCECGNTYKHRQSLYKHQKKCIILDNNDVNIYQMNVDTTNDMKDIDKELLIKMILKNQDVMEKMVEMMPNMGMNNSHNINTNSHNTNNFNIQMFLNDHCKNAMNLTDFIQSLPITSETYDNTIENGLTKTITNMMVNGLNELDILQRPIHCTDVSRKTLYVKDADSWEKDNELVHVMNGIKALSLKQRTMISKWKEVNTGWDKDDKLQSRMTNLVFNSMTQIEGDDKEVNKIIKAIGKHTHLSSEIKNEYK